MDSLTSDRSLVHIIYSGTISESDEFRACKNWVGSRSGFTSSWEVPNFGSSSDQAWEKLRSTLPDHKVNWTMPAKTQTKSSQKYEKLKQSNKLNKNILIAKTLEAFTPKAKFDPFKYTYFQNMLKNTFCFWNRSSITSARPEKILWHLKID